MATPGYMWIKDEYGNPINGIVNVSGRENSIEVTGFQHKIYIPNDRDTGALTGTRKHEPFIVTKTFCSASPILYKACCSGKTLQHIKVSWYQINDQGQEEEYFRHELQNARVVSVNPEMLDIKDKQRENYGHLEHLALRYERIEWNYVDGNISTFDEWNIKA